MIDREKSIIDNTTDRIRAKLMDVAQKMFAQYSVLFNQHDLIELSQKIKQIDKTINIAKAHVAEASPINVSMDIKQDFSKKP